MGTKFLCGGGSQEMITDESVLTVIFNFWGDSGTEKKTVDKIYFYCKVQNFHEFFDLS